MSSAMMNDIKDLHMQFDLLASIEVGLVVIDRQCRVSVWNQFMQNHSNILPQDIKGKSLLEEFPEIDADWFNTKIEAVFELANPAFIIWEQRPYLLKFPSNRPISSPLQVMQQNVTLFPLMSLNGKVEQICIMIYDVTDQAQNKLSIQSLNNELAKMSRIDGLTGLFNRRYWSEQFELEFKRAWRSKLPLSLIILDIDHFKKVNDTYGHPAGDEVIRTLASVINHSCRETDCPGRYGGEEFVVLLPNTLGGGAKLVAERIRRLSERQNVLTDAGEITFTVSVGVAELSEQYSSSDAWLQAADKALYAAKESGRNQVKIAEPE